MEVVEWPLELLPGDQLPAPDIVDWLDFNYLSTPAVLIAKQLCMEEALLHKSVHECFCEPDSAPLCECWLSK